MTTQICTTPTDRFVYRRASGRPTAHFSASGIFFSASQRNQPTPTHRRAPVDQQIWPNCLSPTHRSLAGLLVDRHPRSIHDEHAARRIVLQPRRATPTSRDLNFAAVHVDSNHDEPRESRRPDDVRRNVRAARTAARHLTTAALPRPHPAFLTSCPKIAVNVTLMFTRK